MPLRPLLNESEMFILSVNETVTFCNIAALIQSVYKRTYIKSPVELCGSIFFLAELCQAVEAGKLDVK
jgi:hypothetical protein